MTAERLMDAMNLLDDGMLSEVEALRTGKYTKKPPIWRKLLPLAACFGLVLGVVLVWSNLETPPDSGIAESTTQETASMEIQETVSSDKTDGNTNGGGFLEHVSEEVPTVDTENSTLEGEVGSVPESDGSTESTPPEQGADGPSDDYPPETDEVPSVILQIDRLTGDGFDGTVAENVDTDFFTVGMEVTVKFLDNAFVGEIAEGDRVLVMFRGFDGNTLYAEYAGRTQP